MNIPEILPCPFCGGPGVPFQHNADDYPESWDIGCQTDGCMLRHGCDYGLDKELLIALWNRRQPTPEAADKVANLPAYWRGVADMKGAKDSERFDRALRCCAADLEDALKSAHPPKPEPTEAMLEEANDLLRSAHAIAERKGVNTNWEAFKLRVLSALISQSVLMHKTVHIPAATCTAKTFYLEPDNE